MYVSKRLGVAVVLLVAFLASPLVVGFFQPAGESGAESFWSEKGKKKGGGSSEIALGLQIFAKLAEELSPAVVNINTTEVVKGQPFSPFFRGPRSPSPFGNDPFQEFFERFFGGNLPEREFKRRNLGSGFIVSKDGYIVTNNHVVENATEIVVTIGDKDDYKAKVVGRDAKTDVALIKIDARKDLPVVPLGDSDDVKIGEWVMAIGNPFGLSHTVTAGIVSAKYRNIGSGPYDNFIQTDASINPGNSGGPLFNTDGEVIGINAAIAAQGQGIGFAIPINMAKALLPQLRQQGRVTRGWLGVAIQVVTPELAKSFGLDKERGALVSGVEPGGPAEKGGVLKGDIITEFDGKAIDEMPKLPRVVAETPVGKDVDVKVLRKGQEKSLRIKVAQMKDEATLMRSENLESDLGMVVQDLTPEIARSLRLDTTDGVIISEVKPGGKADEVGLRRGDLIEEMNQQTVRNLEDYRSIIAKSGKGDTLLFLIKRGNSALYVAMNLE
ncbi:MAG: DegQ family serine endoprotease [Candidatus Tectomicrobia bacterium]|nr:DegQ family serine endoprotease [Candidatus Tectomicrobia bacterium]